MPRYIYKETSEVIFIIPGIIGPDIAAFSLKC